LICERDIADNLLRVPRINNVKTSKILIRELVRNDCATIHLAFAAQNWNKPVQLFEKYLDECPTGKRSVLIVEVDTEFAGYATLDWQPEYAFFNKRSIPEIADLNVLLKFQRHGVGTSLMDAAEHRISESSDFVGVRVGLTADYGNAQRLYIKRGYILDGKGISQRDKVLEYGDSVTVDDDLVLGFVKSLK
jgi:GNAT superfamily N-acetyltransferase